jgi:NAD(P)-dependent dehydrogenase (short-subunit alcohol dehydrogenase family)
MLKELFGLKGKTALVTGASSGLGRQMAKTLAHAGASIIAVGRNESRLADLCKSIKEIGGQIRTYSVDLNDSEAIKEFIKDLNSKEINVDILINNAGGGKLTPIDNDYLEFWDEVYKLNLKAAWQLSQAMAEQMIAHKISGSIINISSINGAGAPYVGAAAYSATKAAVIQMSRVLSGELAGHNIRVNTIVPGLFYTELTAERIDTGKVQDFIEQIPLKFIAQPKDLDGLVLYLASNNASRYVTGTEFVIDGGISANCKGI